MDICQDGEWIWVGLASSDGTAMVLVLEDAVWDPITIMAVKQIHGFAITSLRITPPTHPLFPAFLITASADGSVSITRYNVPSRIRKLFDWTVWLMTQIIQITVLLIVIKVLSQYYPKVKQPENLEVQPRTETMDDGRKPLGIQTTFDLPEIISRLRVKASILTKSIKRKAGDVVELIQKWREARTESLNQGIASVSEGEVELAEVPEFPEESATLDRTVDTPPKSPTRTEAVESQTTTEPQYKQTHHGMKPMSAFRESSVARTTTTPTKSVTEAPVPASTTQVATSDVGASTSPAEQVQSTTTDLQDKEDVVSEEHEHIVENEALTGGQSQREQDAKAEHTLHERKFAKTTTEHQPTDTIASQETLIVNGRGESANLDLHSSTTEDHQPISIGQSSVDLTLDHTSRLQPKTEDERVTSTTVSEPKSTSVQSKGETGDLAGMDGGAGSISTTPSSSTYGGVGEALREDDTVIGSLSLSSTAPEQGAVETTTVADEHENFEALNPTSDSIPLDDTLNAKESKPSQGEETLAPQKDTNVPVQSTQNGESDKDEAAANDDSSGGNPSDSEDQDDSGPDFPHFDL